MKENIVQRVVQARLIEATKKNINSKLVLVAKNFGSPILGHYYHESIDDNWSEFDNDSDWSLAESEEGGVLPRLGYIYDSLKLGINLEIVVKSRDTVNALGEKEGEKPSEVKCNYKGLTVYREVNGVLKCYAPFPEWEDHLDRMYDHATKKDRGRARQDREEEQKVQKKAAKKTLETLRKLWGI